MPISTITPPLLPSGAFALASTVANKASLVGSNTYTYTADGVNSFVAGNGGFQFGIDSAAAIPNRDFFIARMADIVGNTVTDVFYISHNASSTTLSGSVIAGATSLPLTGALTMGSTLTVLIGSGTLQEVVTVSAGSGTTTLTCSATAFAHASGVRVTVLGDTTHPPTFAMGASPADAGYRLKVVGASVAAAVGTTLIQAGNTPTIAVAASGTNGSGFVFAMRNWGGADHVWWDNTDDNTWVQRVRGDTTTSNPVFVIQNSSTDTEQFRITAKGELRWLSDTNAVLSRSAANIIQVSSNLNVGNFAGVGPSFGGANAGTTPTATLDVSQTSTSNATFILRTASWGKLVVTANGSTPGDVQIDTGGRGVAIKFRAGSGTTQGFALTSGGNPLLGTGAALATNATDGFAYMPTMAGTPSGTPTAITGGIPFVIDTTGVKLWAYIGGAWKGVVVA